tara:strand:+ start:84 stop:353 length:270 start_codon:yes stop_codon:yes gene_type:complete
MDLNLKSFVEVFSFEVSWLEANLLWVFLSSVIYLTIIGFFLNAIRLSIEFEYKNRLERKKIYGNFFKGVLFIGLITALIIFTISMYSRV